MKSLMMKSARAVKDCSQQQLADLVGVSRQTINAIVRGDYNPSVNLCRAICKALERTLDELFWEERPLLRLTACNARPTPPHEWVKKEAKG